MIEYALQIAIFITGAAGVYLSQCSDINKRKYACFFGMAGQPFWLASSLINNQYAIAVMSVLYFAIWYKGYLTYWRTHEANNTKH